MSSNTRFEFASSSPKGSEFIGTYTGGQRGGHSGALDRSGSFRESNESRVLASGTNGGKGCSSSDISLLLQCLPLDMVALPDQKFRFGELKRIFGISPAVTPENHSFGGVHLKSILPLATEEVKRFRASIVETCIRAKDRVKMFTDLTSKLDKYRITLISRKRQRTDCSSMERSNGTSFLKSGNQIQKSPSDSVPRKLEDRTKSGIINKRVRSSMAEMRPEGRNVQRQGISLDKDRDVIRAGSGGPLSIADKNLSLPAGGDGWEKKMKRKRSVGPISNRGVDGERDIKQGSQQKLNAESRMRSCDGHGFRSGSSGFLSGLSKTDNNAVPGTPSGRLTSRNDIDNSSHSNEKRDAASTLDKEKITSKANDNGAQVGEPCSIKGKASRVIRMNNSAPGNSSSSFPRASGTLESWEHPSGSNKFQPVAVPNNRKRAMLSESSSPPVTHWGGQRPQKISRTRRTNLVSPVSNNDESRMSSEGLSAPDTGARSTSVEGNGPPSVLGRSSFNKSQQFKHKLENVASPAGLSEGEESGGGCKPKDKGMNIAESYEKDQSSLQTGPNLLLPSKKNNVLIKDGVRRQGRSGRGTMLSRIGMTKERVESIATIKPLRGSRPSSDRCSSKTGRPPTKKQSDRKAFSRPLLSMTNGMSDITGESDDDHGELLAAVNSAISVRYEACRGEFWKMMEPIFSFISYEDTNFLKQQLMFVKHLDECFSPKFGSTQENSEMLSSFQGSLFGEREDKHSDGIVSFRPSNMASETNKRNDMDSNMGSLDWNDGVIPWSQRLLAALVVEDDVEDCGRWDESCQRGNGSSCVNMSLMGDDETKETDKMESDIYLNTDGRSWKSCSRDVASCNGSSVTNNIQSLNLHVRTHNGLLWQEDDVTGQSELGSVMQSVVSNVNGSQLQNCENGLSSFGHDYQNMCLDERVLAELHSIGIFPDMEVYNNEEIDDEINRGICNLKTGLYQQLMKKKAHLLNLEKSVEKEGNGRMELEKRSINKLIERAYRKLMKSRGTSGHKGSASKISKQAAIDFGKRMLDRYHKYMDTGKSCFSESPYSDVITSELLYSVSFCEAQTDCKGSGSLERNLQSANQIPDFSTHSFAKHEPVWNRGKKREVLLDDVVDMSTSRGIASLGNGLAGSAKGKRSERDRDQNKDTSFRSGGYKASHSSGNNSKGDRKNKTKPKQKTAQLSTANGVLGRCIESSDSSRPPDRGSTEAMTTDINRKKDGDLLKKMEEPIDLTNLPLPGIDSLDELGVVEDLGGQGQDFSSWLGFDEEVPDNDMMGTEGLEIPMDDLNMIL